MDDMNLCFAGEMLAEIKELYNKGYTVEQIGRYFDRDPDEIFLGLFHLARKGEKIRKFGRRCSHG